MLLTDDELLDVVSEVHVEELEQSLVGAQIQQHHGHSDNNAAYPYTTNVYMTTQLLVITSGSSSVILSPVIKVKIKVKGRDTCILRYGATYSLVTRCVMKIKNFLGRFVMFVSVMGSCLKSNM